MIETRNSTMHRLLNGGLVADLQKELACREMVAYSRLTREGKEFLQKSARYWYVFFKHTEARRIWLTTWLTVVRPRLMKLP
jgi:hypothetical protein